MDEVLVPRTTRPVREKLGWDPIGTDAMRRQGLTIARVVLTAGEYQRIGNASERLAYRARGLEVRCESLQGLSILQAVVVGERVRSDLLTWRLGYRV